MDLKFIANKILVGFGVAMLAIMSDNLLACLLYKQPLFDYFYHGSFGQIGMFTYMPIRFIREWLLAINGGLIFPLILVNNPLLIEVIGSTIGAPLTEEFQFRGILRLLNKKLDGFQYWLGAILSSILFVMCHTTSIFHAIPITTMAFLSCWLIRKTNRLWPSMVLHSVYNLFLVSWDIAVLLSI